MRYRWFSNIARFLLYLVTGSIVIMMLYPVIAHMRQETLKMDIRTHLKQNESVEWLNGHLKIEKASTGQEDALPDLVIIDDKAALDEVGLSEVNHNRLALVTLFHQYEEQPDVMARLNEMTGITWRGYVGRTFQDLGDLKEVPKKWIDEYEKTTGKPWSYYGEGIIIRNMQNVIVLRKGIEYQNGITLTYEGQQIPFYGTFEIMETNQNEVAHFNVDVNASGEALLNPLEIPTAFPAVLKLDYNLYQGYYLAGSFFDYAPKSMLKHDWAISFMQHKRIYDTFKGEASYWKFTVPFYKKMVLEPFEMNNQASQNTPFTSEGKLIYTLDPSGNKVPFFSNGVNIGPALPGHTFTEFPNDKNLYLSWLEQIRNLGYNTIRIYTLLPPSFYEALYVFNENNEAPLYLLQEIWPEEHPENGDYLAEAYNKAYQQEIEMDIRAIHGDIAIPPRAFRAYGTYLYDVSPYVLGYLVGRELEPDEVLATDQLNVGYAFKGNYLYSEAGASPTEAWLAASCDYALQVEDMRYGVTHMVGIVNWPTLDPLEHDSEWNPTGDKALQYNDKVVVDINQIGINRTRMPGLFGAYHIYPNYPDFMNNDTIYDAYEDDLGRFRYGGYLEAFIAQHGKYPAIVAEYGISTSAVTAHYSPDGLNHGGNSEQEQAEMIKRMTNAIVKEGYAGAIVFEWIDEWVKKTWTTENYMIPYERQMLWHNVLDPEQNYGLVAVEALAPIYENGYLSESAEQKIKRVAVGQNAAYLFIKMDFDGPVTVPLDLRMGINLYDDSPERVSEFIMTFLEEPKLLVNPGYNWLKGRFRSYADLSANYEEMIQMVNASNVTKDGAFTEEKAVNLSQFKVGTFDNPQNNVMISGNQMTIRIPYGLLGISDPSSKRILWDKENFMPTGINQIDTLQTDTILFKIDMNDQPTVRSEYDLKSWEMPEYRLRLKN